MLAFLGKTSVREYLSTIFRGLSSIVLVMIKALLFIGECEGECESSVATNFLFMFHTPTFARSPLAEGTRISQSLIAPQDNVHSFRSVAGTNGASFATRSRQLLFLSKTPCIQLRLHQSYTIPSRTSRNSPSSPPRIDPTTSSTPTN